MAYQKYDRRPAIMKVDARFLDGIKLKQIEIQKKYGFRLSHVDITKNLIPKIEGVDLFEQKKKKDE